MAASLRKKFSAQAPKGYTIKALIDVLAASFSRARLKIRQDGIYYRDADSTMSMLEDVKLDRVKFRRYECKEEMDISFNLRHLQRLIKNVRKKDSITMFIDEEVPDRFGFAIQPENAAGALARTETIYVTLQYEYDGHEIDLPPEGGYHYPMVIDSTGFQKFKRQTSVGTTIKIKMQSDHYISFFCDEGEIYSTELSFGELKPDEEEYAEDFNATKLNQIIKMPALAPQMRFYAPKTPGFPLRIAMDVGSFGTIQVFIKDKKQIEYESRASVGE